MDKLDRNKILYILIVLVFLGIFWGWYHLKTSSGTQMSVTDAENTSENSSETDSDAKDEKVMVHITGAVLNPGVVTLNQDARLAEAIAAVGGLTDGADISSLNLARKVKDEEKIHVPVTGEVVETAQTGATNKININTASLEELKSLPGVGEVIAQAIIDYREKNGSFTNPEELKNVTRIGDKIYDGLAESITI
ncbi:competence protein [Acetobacterium fimetarium]|uniref:Competence protein n=1 Tax=Acetobacterium fimetarium TaxID=52691 RepID=A0ABR6WX29_9FIRM|nr:helix-hairpin-helix domain-containing protein [Acetobacterium fimetarium]MBC3805146.1 competence protein [Acetobacterium fimetarium]